MRGLTFLILLTSLTGIAQPLEFNAPHEYVDTIIITAKNYGKSGGILKGVIDNLTITYDLSKKKYQTLNYNRQNIEDNLRLDTIIIDEKNYKKWHQKTVKKTQLAAFLKALNDNQSPQKRYHSVSRKDLEKHISFKKLKRITNDFFKRKQKLYPDRYGEEDASYFDFFTKKEQKAFVKNCQSLDTFNLYLHKEMQTEGIAVSSYICEFWITIITNKKSYSFKGNYPNPLMQPWYFFTYGKAVVNLDINEALYHILPEKFWLRKIISKEALWNAYMRWYLIRTEMIYE